MKNEGQSREIVGYKKVEEGEGMIARAENCNE